MYILGIHDGHNCGATLLHNGKILASVCEERLTRVKNEVGYPRRSIDDVLRIARCAPEALDAIVYASNFMHSEEHLRTAVEWYRVGYQDQQKDKLKTPAYLKIVFDNRREERIKQALEHLGGSPERISFVDHHLAHAASAYYGSPMPFGAPVLILTCDGAGDGLSATVSIGKDTSIKRVAATPRAASVGKIYSRITYLLGLTPWEHEYKVMGLAPYADAKRAAAYQDVFRQLVVLGDDGLTFKVADQLESSYSYFFLREKLERARFDEIAGAVQSYVEDLLCEWVRRCIQKTGIRRLACGGGVFMNVKANQRMAELDEVDEMFVFPSCGDESLSLGAVWLEYYRRATNGGQNGADKELFSDAYLGGEFSDAEVTSALDEHLVGNGCVVERVENIEECVASRLTQNLVVARFAGRMEWGARALGNRSILSNPSQWRNVEKINAMIKMRDFWMPFAPSLVTEEQRRYLSNPKRIDSPYMMFAFDTTPAAAEQLPAAIHPRDRTARAQIVHKAANPRYWSLLKSFEAKTGISGVLNTSFNLHGYPLVYSPADAVQVFLNSGLDCLAIENVLVTKNGIPTAAPGRSR